MNIILINTYAYYLINACEDKLMRKNNDYVQRFCRQDSASDSRTQFTAKQG